VRLQVEGLTKAFGAGARTVPVLEGVSFVMESGEAVAVTGPSGAGKSTLLHVVGTLEPPDHGSVRIGDTDPFALPEPKMARFRNETIGFVFQDHHLLPQYTVLENVIMPTLAFGSGSGAEARAKELLERVGLSHRLDHLPSELSGGERQRAAIARALINRPGLVLCDEPTGNLDATTARTVADLLLELHGQERNLLVVVTHSLELAGRFARRLELRDGKCSEA